MDATRDEVEQAFRDHWQVGSVDEDWPAWPERLTEDVEYVEHHFGRMRGREQVRAWIVDLMAQRADVHAVLEWYVIDGDRLVLGMQNRYYHPDPAQPPIDFDGLTVLSYAGDGLFGRQEDYWDLKGATSAWTTFAAALEQHGGRGLGDGRLERLERQRRADTAAVFARHGR